MEAPNTLFEAVAYYADPDRAHASWVAIRWPNGVACPRMGCGSADVRYTKTRRVWLCKDCGRQFTAKVGTIFEDSPLPLGKWMIAVWQLSNCRNGSSSCEIARALGVTQKTAWFMLHRVRLGMQSETFTKLRGAVEADETYFGGKPRHRKPKAANMAKRGGSYEQPIKSYEKTVVMGMRERGGEVRAMVIPDVRANTLWWQLRDNIEKGATVYTDSAAGYAGVKYRWIHHVINHTFEYVRGHVHTNSIESFWSVLKRTIKGTYVAPRPKHFPSYVEEQVFRFNSREERDGYRFLIAAKGGDGKRITYKELIKSPS
jgi:transposase-like protein